MKTVSPGFSLASLLLGFVINILALIRAVNAPPWHPANLHPGTGGLDRERERKLGLTMRQRAQAFLRNLLRPGTSNGTFRLVFTNANAAA